MRFRPTVQTLPRVCRPSVFRPSVFRPSVFRPTVFRPTVSSVPAFYVPASIHHSSTQCSIDAKKIFGVQKSSKGTAKGIGDAKKKF